MASWLTTLIDRVRDNDDDRVLVPISDDAVDDKVYRTLPLPVVPITTAGGADLAKPLMIGGGIVLAAVLVSVMVRRR